MKKPILDKAAKLAAAMTYIEQGSSQAKAARLADISPPTLCRHLAALHLAEYDRQAPFREAARQAEVERLTEANRAAKAQRDAQAREESPRRPC